MFGWCFTNPCCPQPGSSSSFITCFECQDNIAAVRYTFTVSGVAAGSCSSAFCASINRTWTLTFDPLAACRWNEVITPASSCGGIVEIIAHVDFLSSIIRLAFSTGIGDGDIAVYLKSESSPHDCLASHTLTKFNEGLGFCSSFPATINMSPA